MGRTLAPAVQISPTAAVPLARSIATPSAAARARSSTVRAARARSSATIHEAISSPVGIAPASPVNSRCVCALMAAGKSATSPRSTERARGYRSRRMAASSTARICPPSTTTAPSAIGSAVTGKTWRARYNTVSAIHRAHLGPGVGRAFAALTGGSLAPCERRMKEANWRKGVVSLLHDPLFQRYPSVAQDRQVELAQALWVGDRVYCDDLPGPDRETEYEEWLSASPHED